MQNKFTIDDEELLFLAAGLSHIRQEAFPSTQSLVEIREPLAGAIRKWRSEMIQAKESQVTGFDPYCVWLGIPSYVRPIDFYRLFGIAQFESQMTVIANAANKQIAHINTFVNSENHLAAQRILGELNLAKLTLCHSDRKAKYDEELRVAISPAPRPHSSSDPVNIVARGPRRVAAAKRMRRTPSLIPLAVSLCLLVVSVLFVANELNKRRSSQNSVARRVARSTNDARPIGIVNDQPKKDAIGESNGNSNSLDETHPQLASLVADSVANDDVVIDNKHEQGMEGQTANDSTNIGDSVEHFELPVELRSTWICNVEQVRSIRLFTPRFRNRQELQLRPLKKQRWEINVGVRNDRTTIGHLGVKGKQLFFKWSTVSSGATDYLRFCVLQIEEASGVRQIQLAAPEPAIEVVHDFSVPRTEIFEGLPCVSRDIQLEAFDISHPLFARESCSGDSGRLAIDVLPNGLNVLEMLDATLRSSWDDLEERLEAAGRELTGQANCCAGRNLPPLEFGFRYRPFYINMNRNYAEAVEFKVVTKGGDCVFSPTVQVGSKKIPLVGDDAKRRLSKLSQQLPNVVTKLERALKERCPNLVEFNAAQNDKRVLIAAVRNKRNPFGDPVLAAKLLDADNRIDKYGKILKRIQGTLRRVAVNDLPNEKLPMISTLGYASGICRNPLSFKLRISINVSDGDESLRYRMHR